MFTLLTGSFYPSLETSLVESVRLFKADDIQVPLAIIVPSDVMRRRVQWVLCVEQGLSLFDVSFLTFHQLALRLHAERALLDRSVDSSATPLELVDDRWYEWMVPWLLGQLGLSFGSEGSLDRSRGMRQAIWRTIRDLQEGQVDPEVGSRAIQEGMFENPSRERLSHVFSIQAAVGQWSRHLNVGLPDDLAQSILPWVSHSSLISRWSHIFYYGFYDLTQVQLSLLEEVARARPVRVFFPLEEGPAYQFAQRFLERYLLKGGVERQYVGTGRTAHVGKQPMSMRPTKHIVSAVGEQGELHFACQSILRLVETDGYAFHEIGIVARNLEGYSPYLSRIFHEHRIPFSTTGTRPFLEEPWAKIWWQLAGLKQDDFPVQAVMDILTSPYYRSREQSSRSLSENAHWWWRLVRQTRIVRGLADWERLSDLLRDAASLQELFGSHRLPPHMLEDDVSAFVHDLMRLIQEVDSCPSSGSVGEMTAHFERMCQNCLCVPDDSQVPGQNPNEELLGQQLGECVQRIMTMLGQWDRFEKQITAELWVERFRELLEEERLPLPGQSQVGVQVMDVMAARGCGFRALMILGLNDQVFPRVVREDAFLRDRDRRVLAESLGYKVDEKLKGLDEEALLFALLENSAKERMYLLYQRADSQGRPLIPSSFLSRDIQHSGVVNPFLLHVPLSLVERQTHSVCAAELYTPQEGRLLSLLQGQLYFGDRSGPSQWQVILDNGLRALAVLERSDLAVGSFDGLVEPDHIHWQNLQIRGLSPTALERYVQCPLRYWMQEVLRTQDIRDPVTRELPARVWGQLGHEMLQTVYEKLAQDGWPGEPIEGGHLREMIHEFIQQKTRIYARVYGTGYLMLWRSLLKRLSGLIGNVVALDQEEFVKQGWVPILHEAEGTGRFSPWSHEQEHDLPIFGRVDRVDQGSAGQGVRIVDYKFSWSRAKDIPDPDLLVDAVRGQRLQAPFYALFSSFQSEEPRSKYAETSVPVKVVEFRFIRPYQISSIGSASFAADIWVGAAGKQLAQNIFKWTNAIKEGKFFFISGTHCRNCAWAGACRSRHHPSWARVQRFPLAREFRFLKKQGIHGD
ncbi:MAG: PD-(D/E)XK nuclease family protein [Nitrospirales bacterium]